MAYRFHGKQKTLYTGVYPAISLAAARLHRDHAKRQIAEGTEPSEEVRREKLRQKYAADNTFADIVEELIEKGESEGKAAATLKKRRWFLDLISKDLGHRPIEDITAIDVLSPLRRVEDRGHHETSRRVHAVVSLVA